MNIEDRLALLKRLAVLKPDNPEAAKILRSLQQYQAKVSDRGRISAYNPVVGTSSVAAPFTPPGKNPIYNIAFSGREGLRSNKVPNTWAQMYGVGAVNAQVIDQLPTARGNKTDFPSTYTFNPITEDRDKPGKNRRASTYNKSTKGAFNAYQNKYGEWIGYGERITADKWQPRDSKGRVQRYTTWQPGRQELENLRRLARPVLSRMIGLNPYAQGALTANDIIAYYTGFDAVEEGTKFIVNETFGTSAQEQKLLEQLRQNRSNARQEQAEQSVGKYNTKDPDGRVRNRLLVGPKIVGPGKVGTMAENFDAAFAKARKAGKRTFTWKGNLYTTELK